MKKIIYSLLVLFSFGFSFSSEARTRLSVFGLVNFSDLVYDSAASTSRLFGFGGGFSFEKGSGDFRFETGGIFSQRAVFSGNKIRGHYVRAPLLARVKLSRSFSFGVGGYLALGIGDATVTANNATSTVPFESVGFKRFDYGLEGSFRYLLSGASRSLFLDFRYLHGLANMSTRSILTSHWSIFNLLVGVQF